MLLDVILWMVAIYLGVGLSFMLFGIIMFVCSIYNYNKKKNL
jgi:hypothetical protein